jgi:hypothetical protein
MALTSDIRLTRFSLGFQGIEGLFQTFSEDFRV